MDKNNLNNNDLNKDNLIGYHVNVLNKGYIEVIDYMGDENTILNCARQSTNRINYTGKDKVADLKLLRNLWINKHLSPFEMCSLTVKIKLPIFVARQLMRHRIASYNELSLRYTEAEPEFYIPAIDWLYTVTIDDAYKRAYEAYKTLLTKGLPKEQARCVLPVATYTELYCTMNLRSWIHFIELRSAKGAQMEIRVYSDAIKEIICVWLPDLYPIVFNTTKDVTEGV